MNKRQKNIVIASIVIAVLVFIGLAVYFFLRKDKTALPDETKNGTVGNTSGNASSGSSVFPLKYGSRGSEVKELQAHLNRRIIKPDSNLQLLAEDGIWGDKTENAVRTILGISSISEKDYSTMIFGI